MADDSIAGTVTEKTERPFTRALRDAVADVKGIAGLLLAIVGVVGAYVGLRDAIHLDPPWPIIGCLVPIPIFFLFYVLPAWRDALASKRLHELGIRGRLKEPGYFRLTAYEAHETEKFVRPDNADISIIRWIKESTSPVLYLSGQSGVGKSSLLGASVLPTLRQADSEWNVVAVRPHDDPLGAICRALLNRTDNQRAKPDELITLNLIDEAVKQAREQHKRLLISIDQFEEVLILLQEEKQREPLVKLLRELVAKPPHGLTILLSLRSEYLSDLESLALPPPTLGRNCLEVRAFSHADAQDFLERSQINVGTSLMKEVFAEVSEIEDMPDRVRPVVLNMIGLVLASFRGALPKGIRPGRLLSGYVRRAMSAADVRSYAVNVLRPLVTNAGTKRSLPLASIASQARVPSSVARGCLLRLADNGLVRATDENSDSWEIAHDFVARLVQPIVQHWTRSFWENTKDWVAPGALGVWIIAILAGAYFYPNWHDERIRKELDVAGIVAAPSGKSGELAFQYNGQEIDENNFQKATRFLANISRPITKLDFQNVRQLKSLKGVYLPATLSSLTLGNLTDLEGMPNLPNLRFLKISAQKSVSGMPILSNLIELELNLSSGDLVSLPVLPSLERLSFTSYADEVTLLGMPNLPSLKTFQINYVHGLQSLKGLPILPAIQNLTLSNTGLLSLAGMPSLPTLANLQLDGTSLTDLSGMPKLPALNKLVLGSTIGNDENLSSLRGLPLLPALKSLEVKSSKLTNLDGIISLPALKILRLRDIKDFESLAQLPIFPALEILELSSLPKLKDFKGMASQPALKTLSLRTVLLGHSGIETLAGMPPLPALEALVLDSLPNLKSLDGMPSFPVLASLELSNTGLETVASIPNLPNLTKLLVYNSSRMFEDKYIQRILSMNQLGIRVLKTPGIKSLSDLPNLPNVKEISVNDQQVLETIPERVRLEKIRLLDGIKHLFPLERFKATLRDLSIYSSDILDWNSIAALSNVEKIEIGSSNFRAFNSILLLKNLKWLKFTRAGDLDMSPLSGSEREMEVILNEDDRKAIKLPSGGKYRITWVRRDARASEDQD